MSQPTKSDVHVNKVLTEISVAYLQEEKDFVADKVFPMVPVTKQSDRYVVYNKQYWFKSQAQKRAPATESAGGGWTIDNTPTYFCDVFAFHKDVDDQTRQNADAPVDMDRDATTFVTRQLLLKRETEFVSKFFKAGVWGEDFTPVTLWDAGGSTPIDDIDSKIESVKKKTGYRPNVLLVTPKVHRVLKNHSTILERVKYTQRGVVSEDILASLLGVDRYLVAYAVQDTAVEGASPTMDFIFGNNDALLVYAAQSPSLMQPSGGYIFTWTGLFGASAYGTRVSSFRMEHLKADRIEGEMAFDQKIVAPDVGVFFNNIVS